MTKPEELFYEIAAQIPDTKVSKMFGALCIKAPNGKAGAMFWHEDMIFKPGPENESDLLAIPGARVFAPMDNRPMNGWIHIPNTQMATWKKYALLSMAYVAKIEVKAKPQKQKIIAKK